MQLKTEIRIFCRIETIYYIPQRKQIILANASIDKLSKSINHFLVFALTFFYEQFKPPTPYNDVMTIHARPRKQFVSFIH